MHIWTEVVSIIKTYDGHVAAVLREVNLKVLVSTLDAANKLFAHLLVGPAKALRNTCQISLAAWPMASVLRRCHWRPAAILSNTQTDASQRTATGASDGPSEIWTPSGPRTCSLTRQPRWRSVCLKLTLSASGAALWSRASAGLRFPTSGPQLHPRQTCGSTFKILGQRLVE